MKTSDLVALPLQFGSALRRRRVFHPTGVLTSGRIDRTAPPGDGLPIESGDVLARVSKAIGLPRDLPDLIGLAWRMSPHTPGTAAWDVLMVSAGSGVLTRFALRPTRSWTGTTLTTLMPLRWGGQRWWLRAEMTTQIGRGLSLDAVRAGIGGGGVTFDVEQAQGTGPFEPLATMTLSATIPTDRDHDVSFDPTRNTLPGVGLGPEWLTALRERAYLRSRHGRAAPDESALR